MPLQQKTRLRYGSARARLARQRDPPKLDGKLAALLLAGLSTSDVAQTLGVSRRSIGCWRRRAWSQDAPDADCVTASR